MTLVFTQVQPEQLTFLFELGYYKMDGKSDYELFRLHKDGIILILYTSQKLVVQTKQDREVELEQLLVQHNVGRLQITKEKKKPVLDIPDTQLIIGSDETLKGDTFGGLVVAAAYVTEELLLELKHLGVRDSKELSDHTIMIIAKDLLERFPNYFIVEELEPVAYNKRIEKESITILLNNLHVSCAATIQKRFSKKLPHIVDAYPGCVVGDYQIQKAESHFLAVAAASIIARAKGLEQLERLSLRAGFRLPKGSTHVFSALERLRDEKKEISLFAKIHFSNVADFLES